MCYTRFIGDGDSSVHTTLLKSVPGWGFAIIKLEFANHASKCYRGAPEKIVQENSSYKGSGGLKLKMRKRLVSAARCAIRMKSKDPDQKKAVKLLERDLLNGPRHCCGIHDGCSSDFCSAAKQPDLHVVPSTSSGSDTAVVSENEDMCDADDQDDFNSKFL